MATAKSVIDVMLGEAGGKTAEQRYNDMLHIASSIVNRARMTGQSIEDIALSRSQYNAYGKRLPGGVEQYRDLAERALNEVLTSGPVTSATYYATPSAVDNLPGRLAFEAETANGHQYFSDPEFRGIVTRRGARQPSLLNPPTPEFREEPWTSAVPGVVERGLLSDVPSDLQSPAMTPTEAYGQLAASTAGTGLQNLSGQSPMAGLRSGLLSQARDYQTLSLTPDQYQAALDRRDTALGLLGGSATTTADRMAEMQTQANLQNEVNVARQSVSQPRETIAYQPDANATAAMAAIEAISPTQAQQAQPSSLKDAYAQLGSTLDQAGIIGLSGTKEYNPNAPLGELVGSSPLDSLPAYNPQTVDAAPIEGPVTTGAIDTPEIAQNAQATTVQTTQQPSRLGGMARNAGASLLGGIAGTALGGPIGGLIGSALAREALGARQQQGGLLSGLLGDRSGQGAWGGVGALNSLGSGAQASYGAWGGIKGDTAIATDGSRVTNLGDGLVSRIDSMGRETLFRDGNIVGGGGGVTGFLSEFFGGGGGSQADKARDSVGLY